MDSNFLKKFLCMPEPGSEAFQYWRDMPLEDLKKHYLHSLTLRQFAGFIAICLLMCGCLLCTITCSTNQYIDNSFLVILLLILILYVPFILLLNVGRTDKCRRNLRALSFLGVLSGSIIVILLFWTLRDKEIFGINALHHSQLKSIYKHKKEGTEITNEELIALGIGTQQTFCLILVAISLMLFLISVCGYYFIPRTPQAYYQAAIEEKDTTEGMKLLKKAAILGHSNAQFLVGNTFLGTTNVPKNLTEAEKWWKMAAEQNHAKAMSSLALLYLGLFEDESKHTNYPLAYQYARKGANLSDANAKFALALCNLSGLGCPANEEKGIELLRELAANGHAQAKVFLEKLQPQH